MTELPKKAILQPRELEIPGLNKSDWLIIVGIAVAFVCIAVALTPYKAQYVPPKTYEDCKTVEQQEEFLRYELHQFLERELNE